MVEKKTLSDLKKFLRDDYPEYGKAFYDHFEKRREELIALPWVMHALGMDKKAQVVSAFIQDELLNEFDLKRVSRVLEVD